jgi:flagellin-like hook-associated protein FlgL
MMSSTQNRLATGKKVNSALDNPSNFFTSSSLNDRASDLGSLLDSIGQATKTLDAANNGITSLTKLVQSAKSTAQQARQAASATDSYGAVDLSGTVGGPAETMGTNASIKDLNPKPIALSFTNLGETMGTDTATIGFDNTLVSTTAISIEVQVAGATQTVTTAAFAANATANDVRDAINTAMVNQFGSGTQKITASVTGTNQIKLDSSDADADFVIKANATTAELNMTTSNVADKSVASTSLLDRLVTAGGASGNTLTLDSTGNGGAKTITFSAATGANNVSTVADLNNWLQNQGGNISGASSGTTTTITTGAAAGKSLTVSTNNAAVKTALGLTSVAANVTLSDGSTRGGLGASTSVLTRTYNSDPSLAEINTSLSTGGNFSISIDKNDGNGAAVQTVAMDGTEDIDDAIVKLKLNATINANLDVTNENGTLTLKAKNSDVDFTTKASAVTAALGVTADAATDKAATSNSLLDSLVTNGGAVGQQLTVKANGGATQTITFGKDSTKGEVSTRAELDTALKSLAGVTAKLTGTALSIGVAAGSSATSIEIGGDAKVVAQLGLTAGSKSGDKAAGTASTTRTSLQADFNNVLDQIDALTKDASYNGNNLLNGDDLKVTFNENGSSSLTIKGVNFSSNNLGLNKQTATQFQSNDTIDKVIASADNALNTLRTQASKFGSTLTTVQTRQDFTKNMINTLQTGADALVLADTNEEGANLLALQTRQQLSTTALSMANQASQAVLRLF